jgi:hypothetical protein
MSRKLSLKFMQKSYRAIFCVVLLGAVMAAISGCATISGKQSRAEKTARDNTSGRNIQELTGKWHKIQGGKYVDYASYAENLGKFESYEITADGRVKAESLTAARSYDCIVEVSAKSDGTIKRLSDSQINISLNAGILRQTNACAPEKNSTDPTGATSTDYQWKLNEAEDELCLTQSNGETACYRREK